MNLKEKFENYTQSVDDSGWESIANDPVLVRYNRRRRIRRICGYGISALVVTAVLATAVILGSHRNTDTEVPAIGQEAGPAPAASVPTEVSVTPTAAAPAPTVSPASAIPVPVTEESSSKDYMVTDAHIAPVPPTTTSVTTASQPVTAAPVVPATTSAATAFPQAVPPATPQPATAVSTLPEETKSPASEISEEPEHEYEFFIPNAFTPNGDGINDQLYFKANFQPSTFEVAIFNRRGEQVFHSRSMEIGWDGTFQGKELPGEVYSYVIRYTTPDNKVLSRRGQVLIIR